MLIISCPRCDEKVLVPAGASPEAQVQCPLCSAEYVLSEGMQDLPPALVMLDAPAPALDLDSADEDLGAAAGLASFGLEDTDEFESADDDEIKMGDPEDISSPTSSFDFAGSGGGTATATKSVSTTPTRSVPKKKKKKSPAKMMVEVMLGGVAAIIAVWAILWYVPGIPTDKRDPFQLAPKVPAAVAAWIVPAELRSDAEEAPADEEDSSDSQQGGRDVAEGEGVIGDFGGKFDNPQGEDRLDDSGMFDDHDHDHDGHDHEGHSHDDELVGIDPLREQFGEDPLNPDTPRSSDDTIGFPEIEDPLEDDLADDNSAENAGGVELDPLDDPEDNPLEDEILEDDVLAEENTDQAEEIAGTPQFVLDMYAAGADDLEEALTEAEEAISARTNIAQAPEEDHNSIKQRYYTSLSYMCEISAGVEPGEAAASGGRDDVIEILTNVAMSSGEAEYLGKVAASWLRHSGRSNSGVVLSGQVISIEPAGPYYRTQVQLPDSSGTLVEVFSAADPTTLATGGYGLGSQVLLGGVILEDAANMVPDYAGSADQIVWCSAAVEVAGQ